MVSAAMDTRSLPNLLVVGFQKCGTSSLHYYLGLHPEIAMSAPKELNFFADQPDFDDLPGIAAEERETIAPQVGNWGRGAAWYASHFDPGRRVRGESSPVYAAPWHPQAAERAFATVPDAKLIALVRDPFEQIPSAWLHAHGLGIERRPLDRAVLAKGRYIERVRYRARLEPFVESFGRERLLVVAQSELLNRRREAMRRAFEFLGVDPGFWTQRFERMRHVSARKTRGRQALERLQRSRVARPAFRLPAEAKWMIERGISRRGSGSEPPRLSAETRDLVAEQLTSDVRWLSEEFGVDTSGWLQ